MKGQDRHFTKAIFGLCCWWKRQYWLLTKFCFRALEKFLSPSLWEAATLPLPPISARYRKTKSNSRFCPMLISHISYHIKAYQGVLPFFYVQECHYRFMGSVYKKVKIHKVIILVYVEYQSFCPVVSIGSPHPLPQKRVCLPPSGGILERHF